MTPRMGCPDLGVGVGLRVPHYEHLLAHWPAMDFFEVISENYMVQGGKPLFHLDQVKSHYPVIQHGVSLGIGGPGELNWNYLKQLKALAQRVQPAWVSDHLCWAASGNAHLHDLLPLPHTEEAIVRVAQRAAQVQDFLEVPFALENTSSYMAFTSSQMPEWEFVSAILERANIGLMFDVNNVYVSAYNHGFDPYDYLRGIPYDRIVQIHVAGHTNLGKTIIDTHRGPIIDPVWELYSATIFRAGAVSTLIEWDDQIPPWQELALEAARARTLRNAALSQREALLVQGIEPHLDDKQMKIQRGAPRAPEGHGWLQGGPSEHASKDAVISGE